MNKLFLNIKKLGGCVYRPAKAILKNGALRQRTRYAYYYKYLPIKENIVLYEAFNGRGMLGNPLALFLQLNEDPCYNYLKHVWVLDNPKNHSILLSQYANKHNVHFIQYQSREYLKYLCQAKYLINNMTFPTYFSKKEGQIYINTWHGIPLKTLGFDMPNGKTEASNTLRNFLHADYLISANEFLTRIYLDAYKVENIYTGKIIEEGYPRLDILFRFSKNEIIKKASLYGVEIDPRKKVILYAPTWRGKTFGKANTDIDIYFQFKEAIEKKVDMSQYQLFIKVHQKVYSLIKNKLSENYFVPAMIDANEILSITDILISDFSSIFFDYLATQRPVLFYIPDAEDYEAQRGTYTSLDNLPGPYTNSLETLTTWINDIQNVREQYLDKYEKVRLWSNGISGNCISKKIVDIIWGNNESSSNIIQTSCKKKKILISRGKLMVNGISTSLLNMLNAIDYSKYDVSLMVVETRDAAEKALLQKINSNVRVFYRTSTFNFTLFEQIIHAYNQRFGYARRSDYPMYAQEFKRSYALTDFDYVIDFDGYNTYYSTILLQARNAKKLIWQHNDMLGEKELRFPWLVNQFNIYKYFNGIISCSKEIMRVNINNLAGIYCETEKFKYVRNFVDVQRILDGINEAHINTYNDEKYITLSETRSNGILNVKLISCNKHNSDISQGYRFITVGRLSPEKNQLSLLYAFKRLLDDGIHAELFIVGDGPKKKETIKIVNELGLKDVVTLTGKIENPFILMKYSDCFVLPSLHEGQPMVVNEARVLHLPIIISNFSSYEGVCVENGQYILDGTSEDDIYAGLKAFVEGDVPSDYIFDAQEYNREVYDEFVKVLEND